MNERAPRSRPDRPEPAPNLVKRDDPLLRRHRHGVGGKPWRLRGHHQNVMSIEARVERSAAHECPQQQPAADQQDQGQRHLPGHNPLARHETATGARCPAAWRLFIAAISDTLVERSAGSSPTRIPVSTATTAVKPRSCHRATRRGTRILRRCETLDEQFAAPSGEEQAKCCADRRQRAPIR